MLKSIVDFLIDNFNQAKSQFGPSTVGGLAIGSIYALIALGYTMVYGVLRLINFAHAEIFMVGTFAGLFVVTAIGITGPMGMLGVIGVLLLMMVVAMLASGATAVVLEQVAYRPLRKRGADRLAALIAAIGASLFLQELFALVIVPWLFDQEGRNQSAMPRLFDRDVLFSIGNADVRTDHVIIMVSAVLVMIILDQAVNRTKMGRGIRATAQDPEAAVLMGVNIDQVVRVTFLLGGAMAGIGGVLYIMEFEVTIYRVGFILGVKAFTAAVLGGIGNIRGALAGGIALGLIENWGAMFFGSEWKNVIAFIVLVAVLMFRPTGILGESLQRVRA